MIFYTQIIRRVVNVIRAIFLPTCCAYCKKIIASDKILCDACFCAIQPVASLPIQLTQKYAMSVMAISTYKEPLRSLILAKRWSDRIAAYNLGELIVQLTPVLQLDVDYIIPVPLHWTRYASRGYNQSEEMAKVLAKKMNVSVIHALKRIKKTAFQATLQSDDRQKNLHDAFLLAPEMKELLRGKRILLVDDLLTTGATLKSAGRVLISTRPASIISVVPCRTI